MKQYRVSFFSVESKEDKATGKMERTGREEHLASVVIDDTGTGPHLTITAKAWRCANTKALQANKVVVDQL